MVRINFPRYNQIGLNDAPAAFVGFQSSFRIVPMPRLLVNPDAWGSRRAGTEQVQVERLIRLPLAVAVHHNRDRLRRLARSER